MFFHSFNPQPILFTFGPVTLYWYGFIMVAAIVAGVLVVRRLAAQSGLAKPEAVYDLAFVVTIAALVGARLYAVLLFWPEYAANPLEIFKVWHGGMAIHGALIGGTLALWWHCRRRQQSFLRWADVIAVALPVGQAIGRWGNYFNQELFGPPTTLPWGIPIDPIHRPEGMATATHFHPAFLYESLLSLALFFLLWWLYHRWSNKKTITLQNVLPLAKGEVEGVKTGWETSSRSSTMTTNHTRGHDFRPTTGAILAAYLIGYGSIRLLMETLRLDDTPFLLGFRWPVVVSVGLMAVGIFIMRHSFLRPRGVN